MSNRASRPTLPAILAAQVPSAPVQGGGDGGSEPAPLIVLPKGAIAAIVPETRAEPSAALLFLVRALARQAAREALSQNAD